MGGRIKIVERFASVRKLSKSDPSQMLQVCEELLSQHDVETAIRIGDIFAQMVEHHAEAYHTVERMRQRGIILTPYLDRALLETIYGALGMPPPDGVQARPPEEDVNEEIEEEEDR